MDRCPICRATLTEGHTCRRCSADLSSVLMAEQRALRLAGAAVHRFLINDVAAARRLARRAKLTHVTPETLALYKLLRS